MNTTNEKILDEVNTLERWFRAKKTAPLWAKRLETGEIIKTLEGPVSAKAGDFLCRGPGGAFWPQSAKRISAKYSPIGKVDTDGFQKYLPESEVMAAQVGHPFKVQASWGELIGKPGDFIVKNSEDTEIEYPASVWIVDKQVFTATYVLVDGGGTPYGVSR
jgi:hypothetical protein